MLEPRPCGSSISARLKTEFMKTIPGLAESNLPLPQCHGNVNFVCGDFCGEVQRPLGIRLIALHCWDGEWNLKDMRVFGPALE